MTTPEENAAKSDKTDQVVMRPGGDPDRRADEEPRRDPDTRPAVGAELQDAMERADIGRDEIAGEE